MRRLKVIVPAIVLALAMSGPALAAKKNETSAKDHAAKIAQMKQSKAEKGQEEKKQATGPSFAVKASKKGSSTSSWLGEKSWAPVEKRSRRGSDTLLR